MTISLPSSYSKQTTPLPTDLSSWAEKLIVLNTNQSFQNSFTEAHAKGKCTSIIYTSCFLTVLSRCCLHDRLRCIAGPTPRRCIQGSALVAKFINDSYWTPRHFRISKYDDIAEVSLLQCLPQPARRAGHQHGSQSDSSFLPADVFQHGPSHQVTSYILNA